MVKRMKPVFIQILGRSYKSEEQLWDCLDSTNLPILFESCQDENELMDTVTSYIKFCVDYVSETKTVRIFPNNKP